MKLVIDIDNESYEHIKACKNEDVLPIGWYAISHGTPLTSDVPDINVGNRESEGEKMTREEAICKVEGYLTDIIPSENYSEVEEIMKALEQKPETVTEFADRCRECGAKYGKLLERTRWIPVTERLPENRVCVIVCFREWQQYAKRYIYTIVTGWYARKHSVRENVFSEWEADCDYDEDEDEVYIHEGWYEFTTQGNAELMNWYINAEVVAWMPLPEPYVPDINVGNKESEDKE